MVVGILGCGPAGLFAAQAAQVLGHEVMIVSRKTKSIIYGAQYLHKPIPGLSTPASKGTIKTYRLGTAEGYAERVYGDGKRPTSYDLAPDERDAWDLRSAYDAAWDKFEGQINHQLLDGDGAIQYEAVCDKVISTVPLWAICMRPDAHMFHSVSIMVTRRMEYTGLKTFFGGESNGVIYNGTNYGRWYRTSHVFGHSSTEAIASSEFLEENPGAEPGFKIVSSNCDCHPGIIKAGRMGKWQAGILTHHAFDDTIQALAD